MKSCLYSVFILLIVVGCINSKPSKDKNIIENWIGKKLEIPFDMKKEIILNTTKEIDFVNCDKKIITYVDTTGCVECKLAISEWKLKIREMKLLNPNVAFYFIINAKKYDVIKSVFYKERFDYPIFFDYKNSFYSKNKLLNDSKYHVFLVDKENHVLLIGSPISNSKMWMLYKNECRKL